MAGKAKDVLLRFLVDDKQKSKLKGIGDEAGRVDKGFAGLGTTMKIAATAAVGFVATKIVGFLGDAAKAAAEDQKAQQLLALAINNSTDATAADIEKTEDWINATSRMTGVADDELRPALGNLVRATGDLELAQDQLGVAMDIAAARGMDLNAVTMAMSKAANGNVGALGRLGIKVKDAEGNMLSYEEVLESATELMGGASATAAGSLAGQLERQKIAWEETKEQIGGAVLPIFGELIDILSVAGSAAGTLTDQSIARMNQVFNDLVRTGIDPTVDRLAAFVTVLAGTADTSVITTDSLEALTEMVGVTTDDFITAAKYIEEHADALGLDADETDNLIDMLEDQVVAEGRAERATNQHKRAVEEDTTAIQENIDIIREQTDPLFALAAATDRATDAEDAYNEAVRLHGDYSEEATEAGLTLAKAQLDLNAASNRYAEEGGEASIDALGNLLREAGLSEAAIRKIIKAVEKLNATPLKDPFVNGRTRGDVGRGGDLAGYASGGVVPGLTGAPQLAIVHGGEEVLTPAQRNGNSGGGVSYNIGPVYASGQVQGQLAGKAIVEEIRQYEKRNGRGWRSG